MLNSISQWVLCPICQSKTRIRVKEDTEIKRLPLYCPKCKQEHLVDIKEYKTSIIEEPDAKTQSQ